MKISVLALDLVILGGGLVGVAYLLDGFAQVTVQKPVVPALPIPPITPTGVEVRYVSSHQGRTLVEDRQGGLWILQTSELTFPPASEYFPVGRDQLTPAPLVFPEQLIDPRPFRLLCVPKVVR